MLFKLAFRNIFRQRRRTVLTTMSMTAGYVLCAFAISMQYGSYGGGIEFFVRDHTTHVQVHRGDYLKRPKLQKTINDPAPLIERLDNDPFVESFTLRVFAPAIAYSGDKSSPASIQGVDAERERMTTTLEQKVSEGRYLAARPDADGYFEAMIGRGIADLLRIGVGDEIILISSGADGSIANDIFIVSALVGDPRSHDRLNVYLPLQGAQQFLSMGARVHQVAIILQDNSRTVAFSDELQAQIDPGLTADPWQRVQESFYKTMVADNQSMYVMLGIIVLIVCIGVLNTVLMSVLERTREFGVLRAIGTKPMNIARMVFLENLMLSTMSCLVGFLIALPLLLWLSIVGIVIPEPVDIGGVTMSHMKGEFSARAFLIPLTFVVVTALIVCIPPGLRAASVSPVRAMSAH